MFSGNRHLLNIAGLLAFFTTSLCGGDFAAPAEGPVAFRRDKLPLDTDMMAGLAEQLATLADGLDPKTAAERRGAAQMLALSVALDPANRQARGLIADFTGQVHTVAAEAGKIETARARIWQTLGWLETPAAGEHGHALAACLKDVIIISDPQDPRGETLRASGERGAWAGWIPALSAYNSTEAAKSPDETAGTEPAIPAGPALAQAQVATPLWAANPKAGPGNWRLATAPLRMSAEKSEAVTPFSLTIGPPETAAAFSALNTELIKLLQKEHGALPPGIHVTLSGDALAASAQSKKRQSISAAAAVLASSAVTGREPDATIIGMIDETGAFTLPTGFWDQLQSLGTGTGGRLVLPAAAAEYLPSMLALERPQIFFEYEILLAANFQELLDLSAKSPAESVAKVASQFREIREKSGSQPVGQYVGNPFVRRRLMEIAQEAPYHSSARLLAVQGAGNRPAFVIRRVLVSELRRAIEPMGWVMKHTSTTYDEAAIAQLGTTFETCRTRVDALLRYADKNDRELVAQVQDLVTKLRPLERAAKARGYSYDVAEGVTAAQTAVLRAYTGVSEQLMSDPGETEAAPVR